jgi:DNA-binding GntR family transcriptional regulator
VELAAEYQVGRHTLRAAFDGLVRRGLVERERNRGAFVRVLTDRDLYEIYEVRAALEAEAFRTLASRREIPAAAADAVAQLRRLGSRAAQQDVVEADFAFHRAIIDGTGNRRLARAHEQLFAEMRLCLAQLVNRYASSAELAKEHRALLQTIEAGDEDVAEAAIRGHLQRATAWLVEQGTGRRRSPVTPD